MKSDPVPRGRRALPPFFVSVAALFDGELNETPAPHADPVSGPLAKPRAPAAGTAHTCRVVGAVDDHCVPLPIPMSTELREARLLPERSREPKGQMS